MQTSARFEKKFTFLYAPLDMKNPSSEIWIQIPKRVQNKQTKPSRNMSINNFSDSLWTG